jgi:choline dehydrogenase-like flavoprotein
MSVGEEPVDVVIVGAGASSAVAARRLVEGGLSVTCLEQGDWHERSEYRGAFPDWELTARKQWSSDPNIRNAPADYPVDTSQSDMSVGMFNGVGGGTILFNAVWPRLTPEDFNVASLDGVTDDCPIGYDDLLPYYEATDRHFGVSGLGGNPIYPDEQGPPCPPLPIGRGGLLVARAHARLGWHWWPDTNAIISTGYQGRNPCVQRGTCPQGCGEGAKGSVDVTHWPAAIGRGAKLLTGPGPCASSQTRPPWPPVWNGPTGAAHYISRPPTSCSWRPTGSARPGCCWPRAPTPSPTGWPTPRVSSAAG